MALDNAIKNVGDYYAAHYLADKNGFAKDISEQAKAWKEAGSQSTPRKLAALSTSYFKAKTEALDYPEPLLRARAANAAIDAWHPVLLHALGYQPQPFGLELVSEQRQLPVLHRLNRHNRPWLVITQAPFCLSDGESDEEPLEQDVLPTGKLVEGLPTLQASWEKAIALLLKQEDAPRWIMLLAGSRVYLFDSHTYTQGRYLWIDLDEAYGRNQKDTFDAICALISSEALVPQGESDEVLHERLREGSLKSTHGVSEQLQAAVREAIQAIANGWVEARRQANLGYRQLGEREAPLADGSREVTADQLRHDALIFVYRLLFCFYAEARGAELGILPITDDVYRLGYSLEALRDLVDANEPGTTTEQGSYFAEHLGRLFQLIFEGFDPAHDGLEVETPEFAEFGRLPRQDSLFGNSVGEQLQLVGSAGGRSRYTPGKVFAIQPLTASLFDPQATPLLSRVKLSNRVLHRVVRCLSLGTSQQNRRIGRINYAELGIVQLGSVYEGLLSYRGFFATEDLIQVHQKARNGRPMLDNAIDAKVPTWFVPATREVEFKTGEVVLEYRTQKTRIYKTGEFILHLNGVDRVNSASYYTPEVLTRTLVEEALKERLKDFGPDQADEILRLKICEPAMGSAAFLVEAADQLAHRYLTLKQQQLGRRIDPGEYEDELRRTRHYIAVHNVYGVDLNPIAVELGALSLWLSTIHRLTLNPGDADSQLLYRPAATPWLGLRLRAGNSLIGARRSVWTKQQLLRGLFYGKNAQTPRQLKPGEARQPGEVYHFLVWDEDMAPAANDSLMKVHWPDECEQIKSWRDKQVKQKHSPEEVARLEHLSERIDALWAGYAAERHKALAKTACTASVWPIAQNDLKAISPSPSLKRQEQIKATLEAESGAFQRLRLLMDCWCSFYFWPLDRAADLPSRQAWLTAAEVLLGLGIDDPASRAMLEIQLGEAISLEEFFQASQQQLPDAARLSELVAWFGIGRHISADQNFHHWELIFTEILGPSIEAEFKPQGFDLIFGNPPWRTTDWSVTVVASEFFAEVGVREFDANKSRGVLEQALEDSNSLSIYSVALASHLGVKRFLSSALLYPLCGSMRSNLYKNFIERTFDFVSQNGIAGFLHPESVYDDPKGGSFRSKYYERLLKHYQFHNGCLLFGDVDAKENFSINIFGAVKSFVEFSSIANICHPIVIFRSYAHDGYGLVPGLKNADGGWDDGGHKDRIVDFDMERLKVINSVFEPEGVPVLETCLPKVHSTGSINVLQKFAGASHSIGSLTSEVFPVELFNESTGKEKKYIVRVDSPSYCPSTPYQTVLSGPHIYVGKPYFQSCQTVCTENSHYDTVIHAGGVGNPELRTVYKLTDAGRAFLERKMYPDGRKIIDSYRFANRSFVKPTNERTLIPAIIPPGVSHIDLIFSLGFSSSKSMMLFVGLSSSVVYDYFVKTLGNPRVRKSVLSLLPCATGVATDYIVNRALRLNCVSSLYGDLWEGVSSKNISKDGWVCEKPGLEGWSDLSSSEWCVDFPVRNDCEYRQALVELDVLAAIQIDISCGELVQIYNELFPTLIKYDSTDLYDSVGKRLPNSLRRDSGAKEVKLALETHDGISPITVSWEIDNGIQIVTRTFYPPFVGVDRIEDYHTAYRVFSERLGLTKAN
ncbi:hypothetical protein [Pseudomonas sp. fls2-241-R2A-110]|uniref:hypothetical protein n=1 Tax=Pseudomonas sp. fls2-241-R2A-110 TaxID=3040311 RepID=UPI0025565EB3|nr:hypothetical protein [Pseudomonas sp. fls2-241-R2A-110]